MNKYNKVSDVITDLSIPFGNIEYSDRYKQAEQMYHIYGDKIKHIVGHSLGSQIAQHLANKYRNLDARLYNNPTIRLSYSNKNIKSYGHWGDEGIIVDFPAEKTWSFNLHDY